LSKPTVIIGLSRPTNVVKNIFFVLHGYQVNVQHAHIFSLKLAIAHVRMCLIRFIFESGSIDGHIIILKEQFSLFQGIGTVLVIGGAYLANIMIEKTKRKEMML